MNTFETNDSDTQQQEVEYNFIQNDFHPKRVKLHPKQLSPQYHIHPNTTFIYNHFHPKPISYQNQFHPKPLSEGRGSERWSQNFAPFFPLPLPIFVLFLLSLGGLLVEFLVVFEAPGRSNVHIWSFFFFLDTDWKEIC